MSYQYRDCTRDDHESSCAHDRRVRKEKITRTFKLEVFKIDGYSDPSVFSEWLAKMKCYFYRYRLPEMTRVLFFKRKLVGSAKIYWDSIVRDCVRCNIAMESWEEMKENLKEKYLLEYYKNRLLDQLYNLFRMICQFKIT